MRRQPPRRDDATRLKVTLAVALAMLATAAPASAARLDFGRQVFNVLVPGQTGSSTPDRNGSDQVPLYDGLTPLLGNVGPGDIPRFFKSARFNAPKGGRIERPRPGVTIRRDRYAVPHIRGRTRDDVMFGAGWATAQDRNVLIETIRGPARISAVDVPGLNAFDVATTLGSEFIPSAQTERFLTRQIRQFRARGRRGRRVLRDVGQYVAGINAYYDEADIDADPWTKRDVLAAASLFGAVFGKGGGSEVRSAELLAGLQVRLGAVEGEKVWRDLRSTNDPEAPATIRKRFPLDLNPTGPAPGSAVIDAGSTSAAASRAARADHAMRRTMSSGLLVGRGRSQTGRPLAVMGPQVGHAYPGLLMELDLHGGGIHARGAAFPSVSMYVLLGRGRDFAWSATSSSSDNVDTFLEELCNPDGSPASRDSTHYRYKGRCQPFATFEAGVLKEIGEPDREISFPTSVHGPVSGTVTVGGRPYAVTTKRSTRGRDGINALAFADLNDGTVRSARDFVRVMNQIEFTFNWHYVDDRDIAFFSSGRLPIRARGVNPSLPTLGTGRFEWRGFMPRKAHPQAINPPGGLIVNWNNKPATDWGAADDNFAFQSVDREDLFTGFKRKMSLSDLVGVMNRAATQDLRAVEVWPLMADVLAGSTPPDQLTQQAADLITAWTGRGGSRIDADLDGRIDDPGAAVLDAIWQPLATAIMKPAVGPAADEFGALQQLVNRDDSPAESSNAYGTGWYGYIAKDLRTLLGRPVAGRYSRGYCGAGDLASCRAEIWAALKAAADGLAAAQGADPAAWRADATAERIDFGPLLSGFSMRWSNRPQFQQVVEFKGHRKRR
jgi:acyl-homoserine lactone acylase PvdQ